MTVKPPKCPPNTAPDGSLTCGNGSAWGANGCGPCAACVAELDRHLFAKQGVMAALDTLYAAIGPEEPE